MTRYPHPFSNSAKKFRAFRSRLPTVISQIALEDFQQNFKRQGYVNENGVFIPWRKTQRKQGRRLGGKSNGILIGKGRLVRSLRIKPTFNQARVVSNLPYAQVHNKGFKKSVSVSEHGRNSYRRKREEYVTRSGRVRKKTVKVKSGEIIVKSHKRKMNIHRRPFMITSKTIIDETEKYVFKELDKIF